MLIKITGSTFHLHFFVRIRFLLCQTIIKSTSEPKTVKKVVKPRKGHQSAGPTEHLILRASDLTIQQQMDNLIYHQHWKASYLGNVGNTFSYVYIHRIRDGVDPDAEKFLDDFLDSEKI